MPASAAQLPLGIGLKDAATFENFFPAKNGLVYETLRAEQEQYVYIWGGTGTGKTHLLQAMCHAATSAGTYPLYLPLANLHELSPEILDGLERQDLIVLDDIHFISSEPEWETRLFHLYNRAREAGTRLVVSSSMPPTGLHLGLADLVSRLSWGPVFQLEALSDEEKCAALQFRAGRRGLELADDVADYLLKRCPRDTESLFNLLDRLDQASLSAQRRLTIPFIRTLLD